MTLKSAEWSSPPQPFFFIVRSIWSTMAVTGSTTPYSLPAASAIPRSLWCSSDRKPGSNLWERNFSLLTSMTLLPARPAERTSRIFSGATPPLEPRTSASLTASMVSATTTWLAALVTWPAPVGPTWFTVAPITSKSGLARSKSSSLPPTMMESVPSMAPTSPPLTGASSMEAPRSLTFAASSSVTTGEMVLMSTRSEPSPIPSSTPPSPRSEEHTSELQSRQYLVCRLLLEKKKKKKIPSTHITTVEISNNHTVFLSDSRPNKSKPITTLAYISQLTNTEHTTIALTSFHRSF